MPKVIKNKITLDKGLLSVVSLGEDYHVKVKSMLNQLAQK